MRPYILALLFAVLAVPGQAASVTGMRTRIAEGVSQADVATVAEGFRLAEAYFAKVLGVRLSPAQKARWRIEVVATGRGDPLTSGDAACCTALPATWVRGPKIYLDVGHDAWHRASPVFGGSQTRNLQLIVHEFTHGIEDGFEASAPPADRLPDWMAEGMAEYLGYEAMIWSGRMDRPAIERFVAYRARSLGELDRPLAELAPDRGHVWPGHVGYIALAGLARHSGKGPQSVVAYLRGIAAGQGEPRAFEAAFGISEAEFQSRFEAYRQANKDRRVPDPHWD